MQGVHVAWLGAGYIGAGAGVQQPVIDGIKVENLVVLLGVRRKELIAQAKVQRQILESFPVILNIASMPEAMVVHLVDGIQRIVIPRAEQEVGQVGGLRSSGTSSRAERARVRVRSELWMKVGDGLRQPAILIADLQAVMAFDPGVVHARDWPGWDW